MFISCSVTYRNQWIIDTNSQNNIVLQCQISKYKITFQSNSHLFQTAKQGCLTDNIFSDFVNETRCVQKITSDQARITDEMCENPN